MPQDAGLKPVPIILASLIAAAIALYWRISTSSKLPRINAKGAFEISDSRTKAVWMKDGANLIRDWFAKNPDKPVLIVTDSGPLTVLPPSMAQEIRNDSRLGFTEVVQGVSTMASSPYSYMILKLETASNFIPIFPGSNPFA